MDAPESPDPYATAAAQQQANVGASAAGAIINNYNQRSPFGTVKYKKIGTEKITDAQGNTIKVPRYKQKVKLSPRQKELYKQQTDIGSGMNQLALDQIGRLSTLLGQPVNFDSLPQGLTSIEGAGEITRDVGPIDFSEDRRRVEDAILGRLNEQGAEDEARIRTMLANQGLTPGSEAYNRELQRHGDQLARGRTEAILAGGQEQSRLADLAFRQGAFANTAQAQEFAQNQAQAAFGADARQRALAELLAERNQPINEITALMSGGQVTQPQVYAPYQQGISPAPVGDYIYQGYQGELDSYNNMMSGLFGLGRTALGGVLSDERAKEDVERVGHTDDGLPVYTYKYKGSPGVFMGVMAQEAEREQPGSVKTIDGIKYVDYRRIS